jgi:hypothetical protein
MTDYREPDHHDTVVVKDGGGSSGAMMLGIIAIVIVLAGAWYFLMGPGANSTVVPDDVNVNIEVPTIEPAAS